MQVPWTGDAPEADTTAARSPPVTSKVFISHTTRDRRDVALAHALAAGLEARGAQVWIAPESIPAGEQWKEHIVSGVMDQCSHFVVVLSAASVAADWVLEEIRLAKRRREADPAFAVLPLSVGSLEDHPYQHYLAKLQAVPYHDDFHAQLEAVVKAVGLRPSVPDALSAYVVEKTRDFVGRGYVFEAIERFIATQQNGYFTVEGDPGVGKSAILARFVQRTGALAHFNIRAQGINTPRQFLENVCTQLILRFGLPHATLPKGATEDGAVFAALLQEATARLQQEERLVIAVDALDEAELSGQPGNILFLPPALPEGVFVIVTRRQTRIPLVVQTPQETLDLMRFKEESERDLGDYVRLKLETRPGLSAWAEAHGIATDRFVATLVERSQRNFMYLRHVLPEIEAGRYDDLDIRQLPLGLESYYEDHWRRMGMTARPLPRAKIRIVYVLSVALAPVTRSKIARFASDAALPVDELTVQEVLDEWDEFLHEQANAEGTAYNVYHASFRDFLHRRDVVQAAGVALPEIHALIANDLWGEVFDRGTP